MAHEPTFYHLFRRSRYSVDAGVNESSAESRKNRIEEFAVAALGFTLQHDETFKRRFLSSVCGGEITSPLEEYRILCQNGHCSDLSILREDDLAITVEAKVGAELAEHQKPWSRRFRTLGRPAGYGLQLAKRFSTYPRKFYVVIQREPEPQMPGSVTCDSTLISCRAQTWGDLVSAEKESALVRDFFDSMAEFDIPSLKLRRFQKMKKVNRTKDAAEMHQLLLGVANAVRIDSRKLAWDVNSGSDASHFGLTIPSSLKNYGKLQDLIGVNVGPVGWFGYEEAVNDAARITVWIYAARDCIGKFLQANSNKPWCVGDGAVFLAHTGNEPPDVQWFKSVLGDLQDSSPMWRSAKKSLNKKFKNKLGEHL